MAKILKKLTKPAAKPTYKGALGALFEAMDAVPLASDHPISAYLKFSTDMFGVIGFGKMK